MNIICTCVHSSVCSISVILVCSLVFFRSVFAALHFPVSAFSFSFSFCLFNGDFPGGFPGFFHLGLDDNERERERERDWNSENPAFYSKSRPPYVPRVLYHLKIARVLELMERGEGLVELLPILPGSNVWICYYSLILPLFELLPILPGWTANVPKSLRKVMTSSVAREVANLSQLFLQ